MYTPIEQVAALTIGTVESVSPDEIKVLLDPDAPQATALNTGIPGVFPRINGYVLIPNETGALVGLISWLGIERSAFPKRTGLKDFGLIDLPFPLRKMSLNPVGTLIHTKIKNGDGYHLKLERGVYVFPSVGDPVLLPTLEQLKSIIESQKSDKSIIIGTSPLTANAVISIDPDKLFGRHLAVLGNTGSGKSCSLAGLIRWSLEKAAKEKRNTQKGSETVNARFIILDPNGEYHNAFYDLGAKVRIFKVPPVENNIFSLKLPAWMWNSQEWCTFAHAAPAAQRPLLLQGLRDMRAGATVREPIKAKVKRFILSCKAHIEQMIAQGYSGYAKFPNNLNCGLFLKNMATDAHRYTVEIDDSELGNALDELSLQAKSLADSHYWKGKDNDGYRDFSETELEEILKAVNHVLDQLPPSITYSPCSEDAPIPFEVGQLADHLEFLASGIGSGQVTQFVATLTMRIRMMLADRRLGPIVNPDIQPMFEQWLTDYIGADGAKNGQIAIIDLSLVPPDVIHIIIAVIARIIFEAAQRYRKLNGKELPTVLVLEEAHTFIQRDTSEDSISPAIQMCRHTFERIAREGRKFGLGLVLSSQRPSELSPTVLSQCNTFLLHRLVNDKDQELVKKLVPDNLGGLLKELPSLPTRQAILLGWASPVPTLVEIKELPEKQRPHSADPEFWDVWTGKKERKIDWTTIAKDWVS